MGRVAEFQLELDLEDRPAKLPDELAVLLEEAEGLREWYDRLGEYTRREAGKWVCGVKSDTAKMRRAEQMAERLAGTMEAEIELPPVIVAAFWKRPKAKAGCIWCGFRLRRLVPGLCTEAGRACGTGPGSRGVAGASPAHGACLCA